ncbi:MAG: hypothetical protein HC913_19230 [Microscillaceae bacterium]|nr:hypothetical protein [Microscillaceae bacterium]
MSLSDTRNKSRRLRITGVLPEGIWAEASQTAYVMNGLELTLYYKDKLVSQAILNGLPEIPQKILLQKDDTLILHREDRPGEPAQIDESGQVFAPAHIACPLDWLYTDLRPGEPILFDDGKIEGHILSVSATEAHIRITHTPPGGAVLRADKGINLPLSNLRFSGLTDKDRQDLKFVCQHADVVNMSFVNSPEDVEELLKVLTEEGAPAHLGLVLKIETQRAVLNLPAILLTALRFFRWG